MVVRYPQIKNIRSVEAFRGRCSELDISIPISESDVIPGVLTTSTTFEDGSAGHFVSANRFAILPMEGWDATEDGRPTDLVRRRWRNFGQSGCGVVWAEATAVHPDGRANPRQLMIDSTRVDDFRALRSELHSDQIVGLQLTHSGRWAKPGAQPEPKIAYRHPELDDRVGAHDASVLSDTALDDLVERYIEAAIATAEAGFDFVDIKHCHGYLLHELLSAYSRPGRYGGDLAGRTNFLRSVVAGIRSRVPQLAIAVRLSAFDVRPYIAGPNGFGVPAQSDKYPHAFGSAADGTTFDLSETHQLFEVFTSLGIGLVSVTAGSPYYNPHVQRPAYFPPSDGYQPPEDPLVGVARHLAVCRELAEAHRSISVIGSAYSYLQDFVPEVAHAVVESGGAAMVGLGRMALSYPHLARDVLAGTALDRHLVCRTFSDCTTAPRNGLVSGCFPLDPFYKDHPDRVHLTAAKRAQRDKVTKS